MQEHWTPYYRLYITYRERSQGDKKIYITSKRDQASARDEEESCYGQANSCFMTIENDVFYTPDVLSCDGFGDDPHELLACIDEEWKKMSNRTKDFESWWLGL